VHAEIQRGPATFVMEDMMEKWVLFLVLMSIIIAAGTYGNWRVEGASNFQEE
jgi:hypothetical protein